MILNSKTTKYTELYKTIDENSYLISYISVSMAGGVTFGVKGAIIGLGINALNDFLKYNNYVEDKSILQGFIGFTIGYNVYSSWVSGLVGLTGAVLVNQEQFQNYHSEFSNLLTNILLGTKINKSSGALIGSTFSIVDQVLINNNITDKYYFSSILLGATSTSLIFGESVLSLSLGVALGLSMEIYANMADYFMQPVAISKDLYNLYSSILPQEQLDNFLKEYVIVLLSSQVIASQLKLVFLRHEQNAMYQFEHMDDVSRNPINKLSSVMIKFGLFVSPYIVTEFTFEIFNNFYATKLYIAIDDQLRELLFANESALSISFDKKNMVLLDNLRLDSKVISYDGSKLIIDSLAKYIKGIYGVCILSANVPEILVYSVFYNQLTKYIATLLADWKNHYEILIKSQESLIDSIFKHDMSNIKIITEAKGIKYSFSQLQFEHDKLRESELAKDQISSIIIAWKSLESIINFMATYYLIAYKVSMKAVEFESRISMHYSCLKVNGLLAWTGDKAQNIKTLYQSIERLKIFLNKINYISDLDNIKREYYSDGNALIMLNIDIVIANKSLIRTNYLELKLGNRYVIDGPSGSGKSNLITKIIGIRNNNIEGKGSIYYPEHIKIHLISQQDYFPLNKNLVEIIFYPRDINPNKIVLVQQLLLEFGLIQYGLEQVQDWYTVLSGGEKQKIRIISAIIQEPNFLILDEVFNGLDKKAIKLMQAIILDKIPDLSLISIDHNFIENNSTGFYTDVLRVVEGQLVEDDNNEQCPNKYLDYELFQKNINNSQKCFDYEYYE